MISNHNVLIKIWLFKNIYIYIYIYICMTQNAPKGYIKMHKNNQQLAKFLTRFFKRLSLLKHPLRVHNIMSHNQEIVLLDLKLVDWLVGFMAYQLLSDYSIPKFHQWSRSPGFNPRSSHTKDSKKWYLMPPCLTLSIIR